MHSAGVCRSMRTQFDERRQAASAAPRVVGGGGEISLGGFGGKRGNCLGGRGGGNGRGFTDFFAG